MEKSFPCQYFLSLNFRKALISKVNTSLFFIVLVLLSLTSFAEGTKQLEPGGTTSSHKLKIVFHVEGDNGNGWRLPFAMPGCNPNYRLNVYINDYTTEKICFGFNDGTYSLFYQLRDPDGNQIYTPYQAIPTAGAGFIGSYTQAYNGPLNAGGYTPIVYNPTKNGNYYFEFATNTAGACSSFDGEELDYFDISVVKGGTTVIDGRVWSKAWQFSDFGTGPGGDPDSPNTNMYLYADDGIVTKLNINSWNGGHYYVFCNEFGVYNTADRYYNRKSISYSTFDPNHVAFPPVLPQYKEFLNNPDTVVFPTGTFGEICDLTNESFCDGSVDFKVYVSKSGSVTLNIARLDGGVAQVSGDVVGPCTVENVIHWDGMTSTGYVQDGDSVTINNEYLNGLTNLPCNDIEDSFEGFKVNLIRPLPTNGDTILPIFWNDLNFSGSFDTITGCRYYPSFPSPPGPGGNSGCHDFSGNFRVVNSWWYYKTTDNKSYPLTIIHSPDTPTSLPSGNSQVCVGSTNQTYTIPVIPNAESYIWTLNGISIDTTTTNTINLNFPNLSSGGTLRVYGVNTSCGAGIASPPRLITVNNDPVPTLSGNDSVCPGLPYVYTGTPPSPTAGITYSWTLSGGSIVSGGGNSSTATVVWNNTPGPQTIEMQTHSLVCGDRPAPLPITVNPLPIPTITGPSSVCVNSTGNLYYTESGMSGYDWNVSAGGTITWGLGNDSILVSWNTVGAQTVSVNYTNAFTCAAAAATVYNVTVHPLPVPTITGPVSACVNSAGHIYSTEAGMTSYSWVVSAGGTITAGGTPTSNTVTVTWNTAGAQTVSVNYTNSDGCTAAASTIHTVTVNPLPVPTLAGNASACVLSTGHVYTTQGGMTNYIWSVSAGGTVTSGGTTTSNTVTVSWNTAGPQTVSVNYTNLNSCTAAAPVVYNVTVNPLPVPTITGPAAACINSTGNVYTTESTMTGYTWTVSAGGTVTSGGTPTSNTVTVSWNTTGAQTVSVNYTNANSCTATAPVVYNVTVTSLPVPTISGPASVCLNSTGNVYTTQAGMTGYTWTISSGGTVTSGGTATSNSVTVNWTAAGVQTVSVNYTNGNSCTAALATDYTVTVNALSVPTLSGPDPVCAATSGHVYITQAGQSNYTWNVSPGGSITAGGSATNNTVTVSWNTAGAGSVSVNYTNASGCAAATPTLYPVLVNPLPVPTLSGPLAVCASYSVTYTTDALMSNYLWSVPTGGTITGGGTSGSNTVTVRWTTAGTHMVSAGYTNSNGCTSATPTAVAVTVSPYPVADAGADDYICSDQVTYFFNSNPGNTFFNPGNIRWRFYGVGYTSNGSLNDTTILHPTFTAGASDTSMINRVITFVLTLEGTGTCAGSFTSDTMLLRIDPTPRADAGPDGSVCGQRGYPLSGATAEFATVFQWQTSGDGSFSDSTILHPTYTPGPLDVGNSVMLSLNLSGCKNLTGSNVMFLTVHPDPSATISGTTSICEATTTPVSIALTGTPPWSVTYTNGVTPVTVNGINTSPYIFNVSPPVTTTYLVVSGSDATGCAIPNDSIHGVATITVNPLPDPFTVTVSNGGVFCEGTPGVTIGLSGSQAGMNYELLLNGIPEGTNLPGTGTPLVFGIKNIPGQYSVRGTNPVGNCQLIMNDTATVIMNPIPVTDFTTNTACSFDTTFFTVSGSYINKTSYWHWDFGDGTFAVFNAPSNPSHVYPTYGTYTVVLNVEDTNNCTYTISHPVEVLPHPTAFFSYATPNCLDDVTAFTDLSTNPPGQGYIRQWVWSYGDGSPNDTLNFPTTANPVHTYLNAGTYLVTLSILNSHDCADTYSSLITVSRRPQAGFLFFGSCQDESVLFQDSTNTNGGGQVISWQWDFGDPPSGSSNTSLLEDPTHVYTSGGTYQVKLIVANLNGCIDSITRQVNVKSAPLADFTSSTGCLGTPTLFWADSVLININATATYHWDFGDGNTSNSRNTSHTYLAAGTYLVVLTIADTSGCQGVKSHTITITPPPAAHFTASADNCQGQGVAFTNLSTTVSGFLTSWSWDFGDGSPVQTIVLPFLPDVSHTYAFTGSFTVALTVTNSLGCTHSESRIIQVHPAPTAAFYSTGHCLGEPVQFTDQTTVTSSQTIQSWSWDFGDPASGFLNTSNLKDPTHSFAATGTYLVRLIAFTGNACSDTITDSVTIRALPVTDFTVQSACQGNEAGFTPAGMSMGSIAFWSWDFGDGNQSILQSPTHIYTFAGTYSVTLRVTDTSGCSNTRVHPVVILPLPVVNFDYSSPACRGDSVQFTDYTTAASGYLARWYWDFGDGSSRTITFPASSSVSHAYAQAGTFTVTLTVKTNDSCTSQVSKTLIILPKPTAAFSHGSACQGAAVSFTDLSQSNTTGGISSWSWDFGDPTSGNLNQSAVEDPTHIYATAGSYTARLIVSISGGCSDTAFTTFNVAVPPAVNFTSLAGCSGDTTQFTSVVNVSATQSWSWQFGDGLTSTLANPVHIYAQAGTYSVTLMITDTGGCVNTRVNAVIVTAGPVSGFSFSTPGCALMPVMFTDLGNANGGTITAWYWNFGDGSDTTFTTYHPGVEHTYSQAGTFLVSLGIQTQQGCSSTRQIALSISPAPQALFSQQNTCQGQATQFQDQSSLNGGSILIAHSWDFGDPSSGSLNTSTLQNPSHIFSSPGSYMVTLVTTNASGCIDTLEKQVVIVPKPGVDFYNDSATCFGNATTFYTDTLSTVIPAVQSYIWNFGDGSVGSTVQNPQHSFAVAGTFNVTLTIQDTSGCVSTITHPVTIHTAPVTSFTHLNACAQSPTLFTDLSLAPAGDTLVSWWWDFGLPGNNDTSSMQNPQFTFMTAGTYTISLTTTTENGCSQTKALPLQVWNKPTAHFLYTASPCANGAVQFQDSSWSYQATVTSWTWEFEPYQFGNGQNPSHIYYAVDSCYDVSLMITDIRGCADTVQQSVCVPAALSASFTYQQACFGQPMLFSPMLLAPAAPADSLITFSWNFGDPLSGAQNSSTAKTPGHVFTGVGYYTVSFSTTDIFGCQASYYQTLQVHALPVASFITVPGSCDSTMSFTSTSIDTAAAITALYWDYGDGVLDTVFSPQTTSVHKYSSPGQYLATLRVEDANGCTSLVSDTIDRPPCIVAAWFAGDSVLCQNYSLSFADMSTCDGVISQWDWTWGDTTTAHTVYNTYQPAVSHVFNLPGTFVVKLKVTTLVGASAVSDSVSRVVRVDPSPLAGFLAGDVCYLQPTMFTDTTHANGSTHLDYRWEFGDPVSVQDTSVNRNPMWTYPAPGSYSPRMVVTNQSGCRDTATMDLSVHGLPAASYNNSLACVGQPTWFFDHSEPYLAPLNLWGWRVSDSLDTFLGSMQGATPSYVFDSVGAYRVLLTASDTNGCADTLSAMVHTQPSPISAFSYIQNVENTQGQVQFTDGSIGAFEYHWDFGDGQNSTDASPLITYPNDGIYTVTLVTLNEQGCSDTAGMQYTMLYKGLWIPNAFAPGGTVQETKLWKPAGINLAAYHCQIFNSHGTLIWESKLLDQNGTPVDAWDGTFKEHPCQQDVYVWKIQAIFRDGSIWSNKDVGEHENLNDQVFGTITLIR